MSYVNLYNGAVLMKAVTFTSWVPWALVACGAALPSRAPAQEVQPGIRYTGETTLRFPEYRASLLLPAGWMAILPEGSAFLVMRSDNLNAYIFVGVDSMTVEQARSTMSNAIDMGGGVVLHPEGAVVFKDSVLSADYSISGSSGPLVGHVTTMLGAGGWGVSFIATGPPESAGELKSVVGIVSGSVSIEPPASADVVYGTAGSGPWMEYLNGRKLSHFFTRTGYTEEDYIWLCPDGRFFKSSKSGGFGGGASGAFQSRNAGVWTVSGPLEGGTLVLTYNDGSYSRYAVTHEGTKLFLEGKRYFRETADCR